MPLSTPTAPKARRHIALVGFMGSGKSSVGAILAKQLGIPFVDLDEVIARDTGKTVAELFRDQGEVAFRAKERATLRAVLSSEAPLILATGGGTFVDTSMRKWVKEAARTIFLKASADALATRITTGAQRAARPLLAGPDPLATIHRLLAERASAYEEAEFTVPTDGRNVQDVASDVMRVLRREAVEREALEHERQVTHHPAHPPRLHVVTMSESLASNKATSEHQPVRNQAGGIVVSVQAQAGNYCIELRDTAHEWIGSAIADLTEGQQVSIITDSNVAPLHAQPLIETLRAHGKRVAVHTITPGETSKSWHTAQDLCEQLIASSMTRKDMLVAVGGGVVGDLTGFVASITLRGIPFVQVPTTTLAATDSSVGGKTGINTLGGKNLVGAFNPPKAVFISTMHLATQSRRAHAAGLVEALKMAATLDATLFYDIVANAQALLDFESELLLPTLAASVALKAQVVSRDEHETGDRAVLNYGHTIGHAIEKGENYRVPHGEAVALGMIAESEFADLQGMSKNLRPRLYDALQALEMPVEWRDYRIDIDSMGLDKKRLADGVKLPIITSLGSFELRTVALDLLAAFVGRAEAP